MTTRKCKRCGDHTPLSWLFCSYECEFRYFDSLRIEHERSCGSASCQHCGRRAEVAR